MAVAKKKTKQSSLTKAQKDAASILADVQGHLQFWVHNGPVIRNLKELVNVLRKMEDNSFRHHVNESRNDFYTWILDVFQDYTLAKQIKNLKDKNKIAAKINARITKLKK